MRTPRLCVVDAGVPAGSRRRPGRRVAAFTLIEIVVVMAISVLLLGLIFGPMVSSFNLVHRGEQTAQAQETARRVLEEINRELSDAVSIAVSPGDLLPVRMPGPNGEARPVYSLGYISALDHLGNGRMTSKRPLPMAGALIDFLPAHDTLGRDPNPAQRGVIQQPLEPQVNEQGHPIIVRYFLGLRRPSRDPNIKDSPRWINPNERADMSGLGPDNNYLLFRVEFDPLDPLYDNWVVPDPSNADRLVINPDFFYDTRVDPADDRGRTYAQVWRDEAVSLVPMSDLDLVRIQYADNAGVNDPAVRAVPSVTFAPVRVDAEVASPSDALRGAPATYRTQHGQWAGVQNDGTLASNGFLGPFLTKSLPRITVFQNDGGVMAQVYDSANPGPRPARILTWDSRTGTVQFAQHAEPLEFVVGTNTSVTKNGWLLSPLPALFGSLATETTPDGKRIPIAHVIPGTETVSIDGVLYRRSGLINLDGTVEGEVLVDTPDPATVQAALQSQGQPALSGQSPWDFQDWPRQLPTPGTYVLDLRTGELIVGYPYPGPANPLQPVPVPSGRRVVVSFQYQTNHPNDIVRVDYLTRSLISVNLGIRMYDRSTGKPFTVSLAQQVKIRNTGR